MAFNMGGTLILAIILIIIAVPIITKFAINLIKYLQAKHLQKQYELSIKSRVDFSTFVPKATRMLRDAKLDKMLETDAKRAARGNYTAFNAKAIHKLATRRVDLLGSAKPIFDELVATFRKRMLQSFSIKYWLKTISLLPINIAKFFGINAE